MEETAYRKTKTLTFFKRGLLLAYESRRGEGKSASVSDETVDDKARIFSPGRHQSGLQNKWSTALRRGSGKKLEFYVICYSSGCRPARSMNGGIGKIRSDHSPGPFCMASATPRLTVQTLATPSLPVVMNNQPAPRRVSGLAPDSEVGAKLMLVTSSKP